MFCLQFILSCGCPDNQVIDSIINNDYKIDFKTNELIDIILPEYREVFRKKVLMKIFSLGYNYLLFGFNDNYHKHDKGYIAQIYEKMAFNLVFMEYIITVGDIFVQYSSWKEDSYIAKYSGLCDFYPPYEYFDASSNEHEIYHFDIIPHDKYFGVEQLEEAFRDRSGFVRINPFRPDPNHVKKSETYIVHANNNISSINRCLEGFYLSELFVSKGFWRFFETANTDSGFFPAAEEFLWDYSPFVQFDILSPLIYKDMRLSISEDKLHYYLGEELVCKNMIKESGQDIFLIRIDFLSTYLKKYGLNIRWIFKQQDAADILMQYNGEELKRLN